MSTKFIVSDMTCNHCVTTITNAIHEIEPQADISIDLATHTVVVKQAKNPQALEHVIKEEGYSVQPA